MPIKKALDERVLIGPSLALTGFMLSEAARCAEAEGFGWQAVPDPPTGFEAICKTYERCLESRERYPVPIAGAHTSLYSGAEAQHAVQFLRDLLHIRLELGFDPDSQLYVAVEQLNMLRRAGFAVGSLEWQLLHADTVGVLMATCILGRSPQDRRAFVFDTVLTGLRSAIERDGSSSSDAQQA
jgi:hypothetical protein